MQAYRYICLVKYVCIVIIFLALFAFIYLIITEEK